MLGLPKRAGWWFRLVDNIFRDAAVLPSGSSAHGRLMTGARTWSLEARLDALPTPPVGDHATFGSGDRVEGGAQRKIVLIAMEDNDIQEALAAGAGYG